LHEALGYFTFCTVMEFDFIKRLFSPAAKSQEQPKPSPATPPTQREHRLDIRVNPPGPNLPKESELLAESRTLLAAAGATALAARVQVRWNGRMRSTAGMAYWQKSLVTLNPRLAQFGAEEIDRTLRHELAHLLAHDRAGRRRIQPHGEEWKKACRDLGLADEKRTHDLPLPRRTAVRRYLYKCPACNFELARVKPLRKAAACIKCCRAHSRGRYDEKFKFVPVR
jgi:SprT protein